MLLIRNLGNITTELLDRLSVNQMNVHRNTKLLSKKFLPALFASNNAQVHTEAINKNLVLKTNDDANNAKESNVKKNPVVLLLSWLLSKEKHLEKYEDVYLSQGFDVLTVKLTPMQLMFPESGSKIIAKNTADWLRSHNEYTDITVHSFSVGGYLLGEILTLMRANQQRYNDVINRVRCQVFDSVVAMDRIPIGFPRAVSKNPVVIKLLEYYVKSHMAAFRNVATKHYESSLNAFCNQNFQIPSLFLMSRKDPVGYHKTMIDLAEVWKQKGIDVSYKCWENSPHCSHYMHHPQDYISEVANLLEKIGLLKDRAKLPVIES